jgi:putative sigma-54 modulation protein
MNNKKKFDQEVALEDRLTIVGRHCTVTEAMKNHVIEKISKIDRLHVHVTDMHVSLDVQKLKQLCTIVLKFNHWKVKVSAEALDMYASIDKAVHKLQAKLRRWKDRIQNHHKQPLSAIDMQVNVVQRPFDIVDEFNEEIEACEKKALNDEYIPPKIIGIDSSPLKLLTMEEAVMKMELSNDHFTVFRGEEDRKLKVIYRRSDNNYGIILVE